MKKLKGLFLSGFLLIVPTFISVYILFVIFKQIDKLLRLIHIPYIQNSYISRGIVLVIFVLIILFLGLLTKIYIGKRLINLYDRIMSKVPIINKIYDLILNIIKLASRDKFYKSVVLIEYPKERSYTIGFLTNPDLKGLRDETLSAVFIPTTPNPTSGFLILLPKDKVFPIDMTIEEGFKLLISGGLLHND